MNRIKNRKPICIVICFILTLTAIPTISAFDIEKEQIENETIHYKEEYEYNGHIRVYVTEIESRWNTYENEPYHYAFLDYAIDEDFNLQSPDDIYNASVIWESKWAGYLNIDLDNILVIATISNSEKNQGYSDPPENNPFDAYFVDATAATKPGDTGTNTVSNDFTHTVFIEKGTATWCGACPNAANALYSIFQSNDYPFYYVALVEDENNQARNRLINDYNLRGFPTMYFDGGYEVLVGGYPNESIYRDLIESSGQREVYGLNLSLTVTGIEKNTIGINLSISKMEETPNNIPTEPTLNGPDQGNTGEEQVFTLSATDPDGDDISYIVDWGDDTEQELFGPFYSGEEKMITHTWVEDGEYTIRSKTRDINGAESNWSSMSVTMPKSKGKLNFIIRFFESYPNIFSNLQQSQSYRFQLIPEDEDFLDNAPRKVNCSIVVPVSASDLWINIINQDSWTKWFKGMKKCELVTSEPISLHSKRIVQVTPLKFYEDIVILETDRAFGFTILEENIGLFNRAVEAIYLEPIEENSTRLIFKGGYEYRGIYDLLNIIIKIELINRWIISFEKLAEIS
jgi:hypothetical protein